MSGDQLHVRLPDSVDEERGLVTQLLEFNAERRAVASTELKAAKQELRDVLLRGYAAAMEVADMARTAGISRDTAHRILKEERAMSWREKQEWAKKVMKHIHGGTYERNKFRMIVNMLLLKALGSKPEDVPQSVEGVLRRAAESMRTVGGEPQFEPSFDPEVLRLPWPTEVAPQ